MLVRVNTKPKSYKKIPLILQTIFRGLAWTEFYLKSIFYKKIHEKFNLPEICTILPPLFM